MGRRQVTVRLSDERIAALDETADERGDTRADVVRDALDTRSDLADCQAALDDSQREVDRLRRELRATNARKKDVGELVEYVDEQRSIERRRAEREERRAAAGVLTRFRWWVAGDPTARGDHDHERDRPAPESATTTDGGRSV